MNIIKPKEIIKLINELPESEKHICFENHEWIVTQEWLVGAFCGRSFEHEILEKAIEEMIQYLYDHINHDSQVGKIVTESGFPDLKKVKEYCNGTAVVMEDCEMLEEKIV